MNINCVVYRISFLVPNILWSQSGCYTEVLLYCNKYNGRMQRHLIILQRPQTNALANTILAVAIATMKSNLSAEFSTFTIKNVFTLKFKAHASSFQIWNR